MAGKASAMFLLSVLFSVSAVLLQLAWYIVVPFFLHPESLNARYSFTPASLGAYQSWETAMFVLMPLLIVWTIAAACVASERPGRWMLAIGGAFYTIMIITGHCVGSAQTNERRASESDFAAKFNDLYCSARTFEACVQGNERDILALTSRTNATTVLRDAENVTDAAFAIWTRCVQARVQSVERLKSSGTEGEYSVAPDYRLLGDCSSSREIDAWCGHYQLLNATLPVAEHLALPSPFATNPHVFAAYTNEWPRRLRYTDALLGTAVGCMVLAALSCKAYEQ